MSTTTRYTVITSRNGQTTSRLGRWMTSRSKCEGIAARWAALLNQDVMVKVIDDAGAVVFAVAA